MASLSPALKCGVCKLEEPAPVAIDWLFRGNEFLIEVLRDRSALSVLWVLSTLRGRARRGFAYVGPTEYTSNEPGKPKAESDLVAFIDGEVYLCEVKSAWRSATRDDIQSLVDLALKLRPDVALFAVMEEGKKFEAEFQAAARQLKDAGIAFQLLVPRVGRNFYDSPTLPG